MLNIMNRINKLNEGDINAKKIKRIRLKDPRIINKMPPIKPIALSILPIFFDE